MMMIFYGFRAAKIDRDEMMAVILMIILISLVAI